MLMAAPVKPPRSYNTAFRQEQARATRRRILDSARRLFAARGYPTVTMRDVAAAAGVAVQTVYVIFGTKLSLAQGIVDATMEEINRDVLASIRRAEEAQDLEITLRTVAEVARHVYERFADVFLFLQGAGDPQLVAAANRIDGLRLETQAPIAPTLAQAGVLRPGVNAKQAADVIWGLTSPEWYGLLVHRRGWEPKQWQQTVGDMLVRALLAPAD